LTQLDGTLDTTGELGHGGTLDTTGGGGTLDTTGGWTLRGKGRPRKDGNFDITKD
jgi:hypothetical protein